MNVPDHRETAGQRNQSISREMCILVATLANWNVQTNNSMALSFVQGDHLFTGSQRHRDPSKSFPRKAPGLGPKCGVHTDWRFVGVNGSSAPCMQSSRSTLYYSVLAHLHPEQIPEVA